MTASVIRALRKLSRRAALVAAATALLGGSTVHATQRKDWPCRGCITVAPDALDGAPSPLLVLLHGDRQTAEVALVPWERQALDRGIVLLSLSCHVAAGCASRSFWQWDPPASWVTEQVDSVAASHGVDRDRVWFVGWSGGASYLGWHATELGGRAAAVVFHGGGLPPRSTGCAVYPYPTYFLVGDANPLHAAAVELRVALEGCHHEVTWDLLRRADHAAEHAALTRPKVTAILDWFVGHPRRHDAPPAVPPASPASSANDAGRPAEAASGGTTGPAPPRAAPPLVPPEVRSAHCGCTVLGDVPVRGEFASLSCIVALVAFAARRRGRRSRLAFP